VWKGDRVYVCICDACPRERERETDRERESERVREKDRERERKRGRERENRFIECVHRVVSVLGTGRAVDTAKLVVLGCEVVLRNK